MSTGVGIDAVLKDGVWVGRSALDDRLLTRSEFEGVGIVMGCDVKASDTAMGYVIGPGEDPVSVVVASRSGADGATRFIVPHGLVSTTAGPSSGSRVDVLWAKQNDPEKGDPDNQAIAGVTQGIAGPSPKSPQIPVGAIPLASFMVPQGATRGSQAQLIDVGRYAIPYGSSLGVLHSYTDPRNSSLPTELETLGAGTITLPTDRRLEFRILPSVMPSLAGGTGSEFYRVVIDGADQASFLLDADGLTTQTFLYTTTLTAGRHTVAYRRRKNSGTTLRGLFGLYEGEKYQGTVFQVIDQGVA